MAASISFRSPFTLLKSLFKPELSKIEINVIGRKVKNPEDFADAIRSICLSALGDSPSIEHFLRKLELPTTLCLLAQHKKDYVACLYGTSIPFSRGDIFNLNVLECKLGYPSADIIKKFRKQISLIFQEHFPKTAFFTCVITEANSRMIETCEKLGLKTLGSTIDINGASVHFYGKRVNGNADVALPSYEEFMQIRPL